ncbi:restriction endonuclease, partial [Citrobacter portucalensis]|uniref:restriction endonuclease n=1 Tax=Citrobacter portucalensis TaxID=1639133 RepID=UPI003B42CF74
AYGPQNDVTLKMPAFEWVHVQLHQQKGMISLSPPTICNSAKRYTGDGGIDGQVIIGKYRYLIQAKRYRGHIALQHVQEFEKLLKRHNCRGLFCHTGKTGAGSKSVSIASERMEIISGQRLIDLLTPGSSFTIATAPQTMMKRTAATLETSTIVKDAGKENRYHES